MMRRAEGLILQAAEVQLNLAQQVVCEKIDAMQKSCGCSHCLG